MTSSICGDRTVRPWLREELERTHHVQGLVLPVVGNEMLIRNGDVARLLNCRAVPYLLRDFRAVFHELQCLMQMKRGWVRLVVPTDDVLR